MKSIFSGWVVGACLILSGCAALDTTTSPPAASQAKPASASVGPSLTIPPLATLQDSPARPLSGRYRRVDYDEISHWREDDLTQFWTAFLSNCQGLMRATGGNNLMRPSRATPRAWQPVCAAAVDAKQRPHMTDTASIRRFLQTHLQPWQLIDAHGKPAANLVTGYYEPLVYGSRRPSARNRWPLYAPPSDLLAVDLGVLYPELVGKRVRGKLQGKRVVPYDTRSELEQPARQPPALVYVSDPVDNMFLQIQGSGRVQLTDGPDAGQTVRLAYADHNGQPYVSIGRWLAAQGELRAEAASMQNIRKWAKQHPERVHEMLNANPAVVFFKEERLVDPTLGPRGAYGLPLTPGRSVAVDTAFVPLGTPVFLVTSYPASSRPLTRLVLAQDTGTAIRGMGRIDFYWGFGSQAGELAGRMRQQGQIWVLWPRQAGEPSAR